MHTTKLRKVGDSIMFTVPPAPLDLLNLRAEPRVDIDVESSCLVVEPQSRPHYSIDELLAQCDDTRTPSFEDRAWFDDKPLGRELL